MRMYFLTLLMGFSFVAVSTQRSLAALVGMKTLHGHVPAVVAQLKLKPVSNLAADTNLTLAIGLPLRNRVELTNLLHQIYDPSSTNYHHFLSPAQFTKMFGPTENDYKMVKNFALVNGLTVTGTHPNRMLLDVRGKASAIEKAFHVNLRVYTRPNGKQKFFAPTGEPSVPVTVPILDVGGLSNFRQPKTHYKFKPITPKSGVSVPRAQVAPNATDGSGPSGNYMGNDFRNAYVPGSSLDGAGQAIALVQFDGYVSNDIVAYEQQAGRTNIPLQNVLIDGFSGVPTGNGGEVEVSLDIEMCVSMAPALSKIIVYEGNPYNFHPNDVLNAIADDDAARQVSCSWGWSGGPSAITDQIFQQMALQGQSFFTAAGDSDAYPAGSVDNPNVAGTPADSPYVTSVGGTTLSMTGKGSAYSSETVWNWGIRYGLDGVGSSGGVSSYYSIPSWQTNVNMAARGGSNTNRNFPDVALTADDVFVIADGGVGYTGVGGTSCASPLWAGFMSLVNQQAALKGRASIGFLNPEIYRIAGGNDYTNCFHDTTTGNNTWSGSPDLFYATNNYDLCTGLGTPNGTNLITALTGSVATNPITHISPPPPPYGTTLGALNGGNPNGDWQLFVLDDQPLNAGIISNGWSLALTYANPVGNSGNLQLLMVASSTNVIVGNDVTFTLTVTNYGPSTSSNILVSDTLPIGMTVMGTQLSQGSVVRSGQTLNWSIGDLAVNSGAQMQVTVQLINAGNYDNYASARADTPDPNTLDNFASVQVDASVASPPQLSGALIRGDGSFQLNITGNPGVTNIIQASTNLIDWVNVYTNEAPFTFTNFDSSSYPERFYRARTLP